MTEPLLTYVNGAQPMYPVDPEVWDRVIARFREAEAKRRHLDGAARWAILVRVLRERSF